MAVRPFLPPLKRTEEKNVPQFFIDRPVFAWVIAIFIVLVLLIIAFAAGFSVNTVAVGPTG